MENFKCPNCPKPIAPECQCLEENCTCGWTPDHCLHCCLVTEEGEESWVVCSDPGCRQPIGKCPFGGDVCKSAKTRSDAHHTDGGDDETGYCCDCGPSCARCEEPFCQGECKDESGDESEPVQKKAKSD